MTKISDIKISELEDNIEIKKFLDIFKDAKYGPNYKIFAAVFDRDYIGGIIVNENPDIEVYEKHSLHPGIAVSYLFVVEKYRSLGLGKKLLLKAIEGHEKVCLTTNKNQSSFQAVYLYEKMGFKKIEERGTTTFWFLDK